MKRQLPARPNLEHLRAQARSLLANLREGDPDAVRTFKKHLPEAGDLSAEQIRQRGFRLADAQAAIARKSGFAAWPGLARHVERLRSLEGTWAFHSLVVDGNNVPESMLSDSRLLIDGDRFRMESPEAEYEGIFVIDVEQTPHHIDIDFVEGPEAGNRCKGIFELEGDRFSLCLGLAGAERPERFAAPKDSGHAMEELVRVKHARPMGVDGGTPPARSPEAPALPAGEFCASLTPASRRLQGEWLPVELITSGKPLPATYLQFGSRTHSGVETKVVFGGQTMLHARVRFNESAIPVEVDYLNLHGKTKGSISLGLFRWDGEEAVFIIGAPGAPRPNDFSCDTGSGRTLSRWRRKK